MLANMSIETIALGLFVLILIPRMLVGRTPQERELEETPRGRRSRRSSAGGDGSFRRPSQERARWR
jgi:hypothetical protein